MIPEPIEGLTAITNRARRMLAVVVCVGLAILAALAAWRLM